ncbi:MAG: dihydrolipoamide acetyltransferase family protein [Flavobacteriaceae bacterium]|jgi:2-oxoglutarate dehydrogenase E2 component (dihydrolipoamide succinyltransferase)|nr:dihydrolipoamide acetyltransferase family protein [Flavobacteriaceae bacterium]
MGKYFLKLPKMGESIAEATLIKWLKEEGDTIDIDESVVEIATDKVDSDIPSEVKGILKEKKFSENDVIKVGEIIGVIETDKDDINEFEDDIDGRIEREIGKQESVSVPFVESERESTIFFKENKTDELKNNLDKKFLSPLVKNIIKKENIIPEELEKISGTGKNGRITKKDILLYLNTRKPGSSQEINSHHDIVLGTQDKIIEMSRMTRLTAANMIASKQTSAHVQSFVEADVTDLWNWREKIKNSYQTREGEKLTFTPLFITALIKAIKDFPLLNSSVDGDKIIQKKSINISMATALNDGSLIVPVIHNADHLNLVGLSKVVNDLASRSRNQSLKPEEVQGGTFTITNVGNFGSLMGTPIINQPQVGIVAIGVIRKVPSVIETPEGDFIGIRRKVMLSHTYDHRIINGAMGGNFVKKMADYLDQWDKNLII